MNNINTTDKQNTTEQPFRITGPGYYRNRGGIIVKLSLLLQPIPPYLWVDEGARLFTETGVFCVDASTSKYDIVAGPFTVSGDPAPAEQPQEETAGLKGYLVVAPPFGCWGRSTLEDARKDAVCYDAKVYDISRLPASAIVQPEPKPEPKRIKGWVNIYRMGGSYFFGFARDSRQRADATNDAGGNNRIACIYIDVAEGEGMEGRA